MFGWFKVMSDNSESDGGVSVQEAARLSHELVDAKKEINQLLNVNHKYEGLLQKYRTWLFELESAVEPRLSSLLTLKPMRFAAARWFAIKFRGAAPHADRMVALSATDDLENDEEERAPRFPEGTSRMPETIIPGFGIAVFAHTRHEFLRNTLESLSRQGALGMTHVFIDGDQGKVDVRARVETTIGVANEYPVKQIHTQRGGFGFRKMMLLAGKFMSDTYDRIVFLEDDCFPTRKAVEGFDRELRSIEHRDDIFSVYGHPFLVDGEGSSIGRFQGWGWATTAAKLKPVWEALEECYLMSEPQYLAFVADNLTPDLKQQIDVTPGRQPSDTIKKFFAWDETVCLITAMRGQRHKKTDDRLIFNCGAGAGSTHFSNIDFYRSPPFNMIAADEVWEHF